MIFGSSKKQAWSEPESELPKKVGTDTISEIKLPFEYQLNGIDEIISEAKIIIITNDNLKRPNTISLI